MVSAPSAAALLDTARYPILERPVGADGAQRLAYLDSAATALVSTDVTDAFAAFMHTSSANIHRGAHQLAATAAPIRSQPC